jgi:hypothetical protein
LTQTRKHEELVTISGPTKPGTKIPRPRRGRSFYNPDGEPFEQQVPRYWADLLVKDGDVSMGPLKKKPHDPKGDKGGKK